MNKYKIPPFNDNQKAFNDDVNYSGIKLEQYPQEEAWYKTLQNNLNRLIKKQIIDNIIERQKDVMHPRDYQYIVNNFIALYNQNFPEKMKLVRQGNQEKLILNKYIVDYKVNFFVEFPNRKSYHAYEVSIEIQRDIRKDFNFEYSIVKAEFIGVLSLSDVKFGVFNNLINQEDNVRFYKDTDKYGNYKFMFNDKEIQNILKSKSGTINKITETDKTGIKQVPIGTKRDLYQNRIQRGQPPIQPTYEPEQLYRIPNKSQGKLRIGNKCVNIDEKGNIRPYDCEQTNTLFKYENEKLKYKDKCLSFHKDGDIDLLNCDNPNNCKPNTFLNNCINYKFIKYGGLEIDGNNGCLNPSKNNWISENCDMSAKADII